MHSGESKLDPPCSERKDAEHKQGYFCRFCDLSGQVTIYHRTYEGSTIETRVNHNGEERPVLLLTVAHCFCEVGRWMRARCTPENCRGKPELTEVGVGHWKGWSPVDPTLPEVDETEIVNWAGVREWLKTQHGRPVRKVYPESNGNRRSAYAEMSEPLPGSVPQMSEAPF